MGFGTLKSFYSTVATSVEGAAKSQGFNLQLGAGNAATGSGHSNFNSNTKLYNDTGISDNNGGGSIGYGRSAHGEDERSASGEGSYGTAGGSSGRSGSARQEGGRQPPAQRTRDNNAGFEGFGSADADGGKLQGRASCWNEMPTLKAAAQERGLGPCGVDHTCVAACDAAVEFLATYQLVLHVRHELVVRRVLSEGRHALECRVWNATPVDLALTL